MSKYKKLLTYFSFFLIYIFISSFVYKNYWIQLFHDGSVTEARYGEVLATEWSMEQVYQNILQNKNPFETTNNMLYPFGTNFTNSDSGNALFYTYIRPYISSHQASSLIVIISLIAANVGMFILLKMLGVNNTLAFLFGLAFGYTTYLQNRMGHITYISIYVFPWLYISILLFLKSKDLFWKLAATLGSVIVLVLSLYQNIYFFVMLCLSLALLTLYGFLFRRKISVELIKKNLVYLVSSVLLFSYLIWPWAKIVRENKLFEGLPKTNGWGGAIEFSSDIFGYFIPSIYSTYLGKLSEKIGSRFSFAWGIFENFSYPGIIILLGYFSLVWLLIKKRFNKLSFNQLLPYLFVSLIFLVLTLGPFLHIFGKWFVTLEDIKVVVPLPFAIFHYLPFMKNIRSPGRLIIGFIFFAYIVVGILAQKLINNFSQTKKIVFYVVLIAILIIDHSFSFTFPKGREIPNNLYKYISNDNSEFFTVYEMPSIVRDGFYYIGDLSSLDFIAGQFRHQKPTLGGYFGRVPNFKLFYYRNNPFLGYMGRLMDDNVANNGTIDRENLAFWNKIDSKLSTDSIDFLDLKYVVLDSQKSYAATASSVLMDLQFSEILREKRFILFSKKLNNREFLEIILGQPGDDTYLGLGWRDKEDGYRWAKKTSSIMFKLNELRDLEFKINGSAFYKDQVAKIYLNHQELGQINFTTSLDEYTLDIPKSLLKEGINTFHIIFPKEYRPIDVLEGSLDPHGISGKFTHFILKEKVND